MSTTASGKEILILDDDGPTRDALAMTLGAAGYTVRQAADGREAFRLLCVPPPPSAILLDIVMPGMNGYQATRALANDPRTRTIPIVMVTSKGQETDKIWGLRQGAIDYMVKPVSPDQLVAKAQATLSA